MKKPEIVLPQDIEKRSFEIIESELTVTIDEEKKPIIKRVIHTTADFSYAETMAFSDGVVEKALAAIRGGANIITDTNMGRAGINKMALSKFGGEVFCYMSDEDVAKMAKGNGTTRAVASMNKAAGNEQNCIFAVGNAPTALIRLYELINEGKLMPQLIIGVPVGFVNVVESKELIMSLEVPYIVSRGRKGGSNVAAAIVNALIYLADYQN
ncbi:MAG: precorrin-8X methylmutase [Lachnospiraceae bacterium]|nr:precorrin-8X methylmutase [Lachnospiraceae bacterium]